MSKKDLLASVHKAFAGELSKKQIGEVFNATFIGIAQVLQEQERYVQPGFGTFTVKVRPARVGRNPRTGEKLDIPASKGVTFKVAPELKKAIN